MPAVARSETYRGELVIAAGRFSYGYFGEVAKSLASGDWAALTTNVNDTETSGPSGTARAYLEGEVNFPLSNWPGKVAFDAATKRVIAIGTTNGYISEVPSGAHSKCVALDITTGQFTAAWNPIGVSYGHFYDTNTSRSLGGVVYARGYNGGSIYGMDVSTNLWTARFSLSGLSAGTIGATEVHPLLGASGSVLWLESSGRLIRANVATGVISVVGMYSGIGNYPVIHYVPGWGRVVFGGGESGTSFYSIDSDGVVTSVTTTIPVPIAANGTGGPFVPDPSGLPRSYHFYDGDSIVRRVDWLTGEWSEVEAAPTVINGRFSETLAASIPELSCMVLLTHIGRTSGVTHSTVHILKA